MRNDKSNLYLVRLYRQHKVLFLCVVVFCLLNLNANFFFGGQQTPFYRYSMYDAPIPGKETYTILETVYNADTRLLFPHTWQQFTKYTFSYPLSRYMFIQDNHGRDPLADYIDRWNARHSSIASLFGEMKFYPGEEEMSRFPSWYVNKVAHYTGEQTDSVRILKVSVRFNQDGKPVKTDSQWLNTWR